MPYSAPIKSSPSTSNMSEINIAQVGGRLSLAGEGFSIAFDTENGGLASWKVGDSELVDTSPKLNIWRAPTDNDGFKAAQDWVFTKDLYQWKDVGLDQLSETVEGVTVEQPQPQVVKITVRTIYSTPKHEEAVAHQQTYTITGDGAVEIENDVQVNVNVDNLPRVGLSMKMPAGYENFSWFGRGPYENYRDRKAGTAVGLYHSTVDDQYVPYILPQEKWEQNGCTLAVFNRQEWQGSQGEFR